MSLPDIADVEISGSEGNITRLEDGRPPLRTKEEIHVCGSHDSDTEDDEIQYHLPQSYTSACSENSCHSHNLEYVSNTNPIETETFSTLRRATIRTLSGEQLLRGHTSGPLWFGDEVAGYTIAYVFRLGDLHARGRQRYYALLALAGSDTRRAFEACTLIWTLFEQIASHIIQSAEEVAARSVDNASPPERGQITPVSSFLTGRAMDPDGFPRRGVANVRANGVAELVDNGNFFCELHIMFVGMLQELGRILGGMRVKSPASSTVIDKEGKPVGRKWVSREGSDSAKEVAVVRPGSVLLGLQPTKSSQAKFTRCPTPVGCGPGMVAHRSQVAV